MAHPFLHAVDYCSGVPKGCGRAIGALTCLFDEFSPFHRAYYNYYRLNNKYIDTEGMGQLADTS